MPDDVAHRLQLLGVDLRLQRHDARGGFRAKLCRPLHRRLHGALRLTRRPLGRAIFQPGPSGAAGTDEGVGRGRVEGDEEGREVAMEEGVSGELKLLGEEAAEGGGGGDGVLHVVQHRPVE